MTAQHKCSKGNGLHSIKDMWLHSRNVVKGMGVHSIKDMWLHSRNVVKDMGVHNRNVALPVKDMWLYTQKCSKIINSAWCWNSWYCVIFTEAVHDSYLFLLVSKLVCSICVRVNRHSTWELRREIYRLLKKQPPTCCLCWAVFFVSMNDSIIFLCISP